MRLIYLILAAVTLFACKQRSTDPLVVKSKLEVHDSTLFEKLVSKFGEPKSVDSTVFIIYKWESDEEEYGRKFKYLIDKNLNLLPETSTDFDVENVEPRIIDSYTWETPEILVLMKNSFWENETGKIQSLIEVRIDNK